MTEDDPGPVERAFAKGGQLLAETRAAREDSLRSQLGTMLATLGRTDDYALGLTINAITIALGLGVYAWTSGWLAYAGAVFAILGVLGIVSGVLRL